MYIYTYILICVCIYIYAHIHMYMWFCIYVYMCVRVYLHMTMCKRLLCMCMCIYIHIHIQTCACATHSSTIYKYIRICMLLNHVTNVACHRLTVKPICTIWRHYHSLVPRRNLRVPQEQEGDKGQYLGCWGRLLSSGNIKESGRTCVIPSMVMIFVYRHT